MSESVVTESSTYVLAWDDEVEAVVLRWGESVSGEAYREPLEEALDLLSSRNGRSVLADCRQLGPIAEADVRWTKADWMPRMIDAGLEHAANVYPESVEAKVKIDEIARSVPDPDVERLFTHDPQAARDWLRTR